MVLTIAFLDVRTNFSQCGIGHLGGVGTHVGDQTNRAAIANAQTFVKLLGNGHGPLGSKPQLASGFLLHGTGRERSGRPLPHVSLPNLCNLIVSIGQFGLVTACVFFLEYADSSPLPFHRVQGGGKLILLYCVRACFTKRVVDSPRFDWYESFYLPLAVDHHAKGYRLYPACGGSPLHASPEQWADLVSH